ncbi:MAG: alpha/beta fold hydrolase [Actinomycetota bacterium]
MPELTTDDATLHVEVDGAGEPVTVFAHGLTNSCLELAAFTPFAPGTKVRFCFRGHGHSSTPPAALDRPIGDRALFDRTAELLETLPRDEAIEAVLAESGRAEAYAQQPGLRDFDLLLWQDMNPVGVARAIRQVIGDVAVDDRERLRAVTAPALIIAREGDAVHPASVARALADLIPMSELVTLGSEEELMDAIPDLVGRVSSFLGGGP